MKVASSASFIDVRQEDALIMMARKMSGAIAGVVHVLFAVVVFAVLACIIAAYYCGRSQVSEVVNRKNPPAAAMYAPPNNAQLNTELIEAGRTGQQGKVAELVKAGANINWRDANGKTALHYAAAGGHNGTTGDLLRLGADPNIRDQAGRTALDYAQADGHQATVEEFAKANVKVLPPPTPIIRRVIIFSYMIVLLLFLFIPLLIVLLLARHLVRRRGELKLSRDEDAQVEQLGAMAQKLEERMANLETILTHRERAPERDLGVEL